MEVEREGLDLGADASAAAVLEGSRVGEPGGVLVERLDELVDALPTRGHGEHDGRPPGSGLAALPQRQHVAQLPSGGVSAVAVGLVDRVDVADLQDPRLGRLDPVAHAGRDQHHGRVRRPGDLDLGLPDAHRLDDDGVEAGRIQDAYGLRRRGRQPAEATTRGHRPDEHVAGRARAPACGSGHRAARRRRTARSGRRRAPRRAPPEPGTRATRADVVVDFPTPGDPVIPRTRA